MTDQTTFPAFDSYVCEGDSVTVERDGFTLTARIYRDDCADRPDERDDGFWPSLDPEDAGFIGKDGDIDEAQAKAESIMAAWRNDEWFYCGVAVTVSRAGVDLTNEFSNALWGVECNYPGSDNSYLGQVAEELAGEALNEARAKLAELAE